MHFGTIIFTIYTNGVCDDLRSENFLCADVLKMFSVVNSLSDCLSLNLYLEEVQHYCTVNCMYFDISKEDCFFLTEARGEYYTFTLQS